VPGERFPRAGAIITAITLGLGAATSVAAPDACDAAKGAHIVVAVKYDPAGTNRDLNAAKLIVDYPTTLRLPGDKTAPELRERIKVLATKGDVRAAPAVFGTDAAPQLNLVLASFADTGGEVGDGIPPGDVLDVHFDCAGTSLPADAQLGCRVDSANDIFSNPLETTCTVRLVH
jgi:hypothetical protein